MRIIAASILLITTLINMPISVPAQTDLTSSENYKTKFELLLEASRYTGVTTPEDALSLWGEGLKMRSAAMQILPMTDILKREYTQQLDKLNSNWVTGVSSPWVEGFVIEAIEKKDDNSVTANLSFEVKSNTPPAEYYNAELQLRREGPFWRIVSIATDEELYPYTLFNWNASH